jgi:hypothetical protein
MTHNDIMLSGGGHMVRKPFSTKLEETNIKKLARLSELTRINQTKLLDEALEDLFKKYEKLKQKSPT